MAKKRTTSEARFERLKKAGLLRRSDIKGSLNQRRNADKLRRLETLYTSKLRKYLDSKQYQKIRTRDPVLKLLEPPELRKLDIPFVFVRTGVRAEKNREVENKIKKIRKRKDAIVVETDGPKITRLKVSAIDAALDPDKLRKAAAKFPGLIRTNVGFNIVQRYYTPGQISELIQILNRYGKDPGDLIEQDVFAFDIIEFEDFEGVEFELEE